MYYLTKFIKNKILKNNKFFSKVKPRKSAPPTIKKWIKKNQNELIEEIIVCRKPVQEAVKHLLNIVSLGKFDKSLKGLNYDDIFHLYLYITINGKSYRVEKNEIVTLNVDKPDHKEDCLNINMFEKKANGLIRNSNKRKITLGEFMKNGQQHQKHFWSYDPKNNNCQDFAVSLLVGNKLIKNNGIIYKFIKQDAKQIFKKNPKYLHKFGKSFTDIAAIFDFITNGFK